MGGCRNFLDGICRNLERTWGRCLLQKPGRLNPSLARKKTLRKRYNAVHNAAKGNSWKKNCRRRILFFLQSAQTDFGIVYLETVQNDFQEKKDDEKDQKYC